MNAEYKKVATMNPITGIRESACFSRGVAGIVLATFLSLNLSVTFANAPVAEARTDSVPELDEHATTIIAITTALQQLEHLSSAQRNLDAALNRLKALATRLAALDKQVNAEFGASEAMLKRLNAVRALDASHQALGRFRAESAAVHAQLQAVIGAAPPAVPHAAKTLRERLRSYSTGVAHEPFDPRDMRFQVLHDTVRAPKANAKDLKRVLDPNLKQLPAFIESLPLQKRRIVADDLHASTSTSFPVYTALWRHAGDVELATVGSLAGLATSTVTSEYLAENDDVQITSSIRALATQLNNHPLEIFNWVRNNIEFAPTHGSIQGSDVTLLARRGNAYDTASLLIALLRAAGVAARYAYGTVQIPTGPALNWIGQMQSADAAAVLMSQGGIPNASIISGGSVTALRLEHVWVEAFVDFYPSRGAKNIAPDTWVPMDPSFKQHTSAAGMDLEQQVPFDVQALLSNVRAGAEVNEGEGWLRGIDEPILQEALSSYRARIEDYVADQHSDASLGDVLGAQSIVSTNAPIFAGSLPYRLIAVGNRYAALPATLRHAVRFEFFANAADRTYDSAEFSVERSLPSLAGKRLSLAYEPASAEEKQLLANAFQNHETNFPAYAISFRPILRLEGETIGIAASTAAGSGQYLRVTTVAPWYERPKDYALKSGDAFALAVNAAGVTPSMVDARKRAHDLSDGEDSAFIDEMFYQVGLAYWSQEEALAGVVGALNGVASHMMPSHGMAGAPITVTYRYGVPSRATYKSRVLDVKDIVLTAQHRNDESRIPYARTRGYLGSYLESGIYEQAFLMAPGNSISAVTGLQIANQQNIRIYTVTAQNASSVMPQLQVDERVKADITAAVNSGFEVTVPQSDIAVDSFSGTGYIIFDPQSGAGQYLISGGRNGNSSSGATAVYPMPFAPAYLLLASMTLSRGMAFRHTGRTVTGITISTQVTSPGPTGGGAGGGAGMAASIALVIGAMALASEYKAATESLYPPLNPPRVFRHYTRPATVPLILGSKTILGSPPGGDLNPDFWAVFVEEPVDASVVCPMQPAQSAGKTADYNLTLLPGESPNDRARGYVEVEVTRSGYWDLLIGKGANNNGIVETYFKLPFVHFGPYAVAIRQHGPGC